MEDAEHLDIPGIILKPSHKQPIARYGIDRHTLSRAGIQNEVIDRLYRALFVYSIGFYELVKRCLAHSEKNYVLVTSMWKVFAVLLEYCCKADYRMLIAAMSKEHKEELESMEHEFQTRIDSMLETEKTLKHDLELLLRDNEEQKREREEEKEMRVKLEEEVLTKQRNHEDEVQLRLKFESKLNYLHSLHRDLESKYERSLEEIDQLNRRLEELTTTTNDQKDELVVLRADKIENQSQIAYDEGRIKMLN